MASSHNITSYEQLELVHPYAAASACEQHVWYRERDIDAPLIPAEILVSLMKHHARVAEQRVPNTQTQVHSTPDTSCETTLPATLSTEPTAPDTQIPKDGLRSSENYTPKNSGAPKSSPGELIDWSPSPPSHQRRVRSPPRVSRTISPPPAEPHTLGSSPPRGPRQPIRYSPPPDSSDPESLEQVVLEPYQARSIQALSNRKEEPVPPTPIHSTLGQSPKQSPKILPERSDSSDEEVENPEVFQEPSPRVVIHQTPFTHSKTQKSSSSTKSSTKAAHVIHQTPYESLHRSVDVSPSVEESRRHKRPSDQQGQAESPDITPESAKVKKKVKGKDKTRQQAAKLQAHLKQRLSGNFGGNSNPYQF